MSEPRAALIRVTPEAMTRLLKLPDGNQVLRFLMLGGVLHCHTTGPLMPEHAMGEELQTLTPEDLAERKQAFKADQ